MSMSNNEWERINGRLAAHAAQWIGPYIQNVYTDGHMKLLILLTVHYTVPPILSFRACT